MQPNLPRYRAFILACAKMAAHVDEEVPEEEALSVRDLKPKRETGLGRPVTKG